MAAAKSVSKGRGGRERKEEHADDADDEGGPIMFDGAPDDEIQRIALFKQSLNSSGTMSWGARHAVLSQSYLTFFEPNDATVEIDRIPLIEIGKISSKFLENEGIEIGDPIDAGKASSVYMDKLCDTHDMTFLIRTVPGGR